MATGTTTSTGAPFAKLVDLGDAIIGALASDPGVPESRRPVLNFTTRQPEMKADGTPRKEEVVHFIAMPGISAKTGTADTGYAPIEAGQHIRTSVSGHRWSQVIDARKALPAYKTIRAGQSASGDVYEIRLVGWSAATDNPAAAQAAGFQVVDGRIRMTTQEQREQFILARTRANQPTAHAADLEITIRRPLPSEAAWEAQADALFATKPWLSNGSSGGESTEEAEPFPAQAASQGPGF